MRFSNKPQLTMLLRALIIAFSLVIVGCAAKKPAEPTEPQLTEEERRALLVAEAAKELLQSAIADMQAENWTEATRKLEAMHIEEPTLVVPVINLGIVALRQEQWNKAKEYFDKALTIKPDSKESLNFLGVIARQEGKFEDAENFYRQALEIDPAYASAQLNLGIVLDLYMGRLEEALALYEAYQAAQAEPDAQVKDWIFDLKGRLR